MHLRERHRHAAFFGNLQRIAQPYVINMHAEESSDDCAVGAMPVVRLRKRTVQRDLRLHNAFAEQIVCRQPDSRRARRMRAARTNHDRSD